jgi:hypothetical protein
VAPLLLLVLLVLLLPTCGACNVEAGLLACSAALLLRRNWPALHLVSHRVPRIFTGFP